MNRIGIWRGGKSSIFVDLLIYSMVGWNGSFDPEPEV